jgi:hypothetical protein
MAGPLDRQKGALEAEIGDLRAQKEALEREVFDFQARTKAFQTNKSRQGEHNAYSVEQITAFRRRFEEQDQLNAKLEAKKESLVRAKTDLEKLIQGEAEVQTKRREELEDLLRELNIVFEEENEKRSQLESTKLVLQGELTKTRKLLQDELAKRKAFEDAFARDLEALRMNAQSTND